MFGKKLNDLIGKKMNNFVLMNKIGYGSFGQIYLGYHQGTKKNYALKVENRRIVNPSLIDTEVEILSKLSCNRGFPIVHCHFKEFLYNVLAMDLLGPNLGELHGICEN